MSCCAKVTLYYIIDSIRACQLENKTTRMNILPHNLIPCYLCNMFWKADKQATDNFLSMNKNDIVCRNCHEKMAMQKHIEHLNCKIAQLTNSVNRLKNIRVLEEDIDDLSAQFGSWNLNHGENEIGLQEVVVVSNNHSSSTTISENNSYPGGQTSVWSDCSDTVSSISRVHHDNFPLDLSSRHTSIVVDSSHDSECVHISDDNSVNGKTKCPVEKSVPNFLLDDNVEGVDEVELSSTQLTNQSTDSKAEIKHVNKKSCSDTLLSKNKALSKFQEGNKVETLILGDSTFQDLILCDNLMVEDQYFKIAKHGATVDDLINNALYFINNLLPGVRNVILHIGFDDVSKGKLEKIKKQLSDFITLMNEINIKVVICGPIPYRHMHNEAFSRAYAVNMWMIEQLRFSQMKFALVDCFDLMWKSHNSFIKGRNLLSHFGYWILEGAISSCVTQND